MKRIWSLIPFVVVVHIQAIDLHKDKVFQPLKVAIEQAQSIAKIQAAWGQVTAGLSGQNQRAVAAQAVEHAREHKAALEKVQHALGNKTYDAAKLKWAGAQLAGVAYCVGSLPVLWLWGSKFSHTSDRLIIRQIFAAILIPIIFPVELFFRNRTATGLAVAVEPCLRLYCTVNWIHKGCKNLYQGMNAKKLIEQKVSNLEAAIEYLQPLSGHVTS